MLFFVERLKTAALVVILALFALFAVHIYKTVSAGTRYLKELEAKQAAEYAARIASLIADETENLSSEHLENSRAESIDKINMLLRTFMTEEYRYLYIVRKNGPKTFNILYDASGKSDRSEPFFPRDEAFYDAYEKGEALLVSGRKKEAPDEVWRTMLYPLKDANGSVNGMVVLELSSAHIEKIEGVRRSLDRLFKTAGVAAGIFAFIVFYGLIYYYRWYVWHYIDGITYAKNRTYLSDFMRKYTLKSYGVALIDIDGFKHVNRSVGAEGGDMILRRFAKNLKTMLPFGSEVVRTVGAEFFVMVPQRAFKKRSLEEMLRNVSDTLGKKQYVSPDGKKASFTLSVVAVEELPLQSVSELSVLLHFLDEKMFLVKSKGKNSILLVEDDQAEALRFKNSEYVKTLLENGGIACLYQPIVNMKTKKAVKYEALVRLVDPDTKKQISPYLFMESLKGTSHYIKLTKMVLSEVFLQLERYDKIAISVNLDLSDLLNEELIEAIEWYLKSHRGCASRLTFEIVEDQEIKDFEKVRKTLERLRRYGSQIALDDFGSGFASYRYLVKLDWDILKIDGSLVKELENNTKKAKNVLASIKAVADLNRYVLIAEFIENETFCTLLTEIGIVLGQGYFFAKPDTLRNLIEQGHTVKCVS